MATAIMPRTVQGSDPSVSPLLLLHQYRELFAKQPVKKDGSTWRYAFITGGRGSAKSFHVSLFLLNLTYEVGHVILFTRYTLTSANLSIIPEFKEKIGLLNREADFHITANEIINLKTGSRILFRGIKTSSGNQTAALKSIQGVTTWVLDEAEELVDETTFERIDLSIRHKTLPNRVILVLNPSTYSHFLYQNFIQKGPRADTLYIHTTWEDNRHNLAQSWIEKAEEVRERNPARYNHIFGGLWSKEKPGLLWTRADIERCRISTAPELSRVVVGIDPAATSHMESNETGIVVVGMDRQRRAYVLEDLSGRYNPNQWASIAIDAAKRWKGSIVAETNQGGDMVTSVIRSIGDRASGVRIIDVRASRGKYARAEPVYSLYTESRVYHVGEFPILEQQMAGFNPDDDVDSPDRVDALVWALTAQLLTGSTPFVI